MGLLIYAVKPNFSVIILTRQYNKWAQSRFYGYKKQCNISLCWGKLYMSYEISKLNLSMTI